jgi:mannose-6-phosphate isomerase-like protein (cupin superfamily)
MSVNVVTGVGKDGRSTVISVEEKASFAADGFDEMTDTSVIHDGKDDSRQSIAKLYDIDHPTACERPTSGELLPIATKPGGALWLEMKFDGHYETEFHRTDSIDFHYVVSGEVELILEDGRVTLKGGDTAILPGIVHRWRSAVSWHSNLFVIGLDPV